MELLWHPYPASYSVLLCPLPNLSPCSLLSWMGSEMTGWRASVKFPLLSRR